MPNRPAVARARGPGRHRALVLASCLVACGNSGSGGGPSRDAGGPADTGVTTDATLGSTSDAGEGGAQSESGAPQDAEGDGATPQDAPGDAGDDGTAGSPSSDASDAEMPIVDAQASDAASTSDAVATDASTDGPSPLPDASDATAPASCGGTYSGPFVGSYSSSLALGIPLAVAGTVTIPLAPAGAAGTTCAFAGDTRDCGSLFFVQDGTVAASANSTGMVGDATIGGYPYRCSVTGAVDCVTGAFVGGWLECTYCIGSFTSAGTCSVVGGKFAGTMTASYDLATHAFVDGTWNGTEALAGNDGGSPGPEGGPPSAYLSDSGTYGFAGPYGGSGTWSATRQ
jgi:hypothetical protein